MQLVEFHYDLKVAKVVNIIPFICSQSRTRQPVIKICSTALSLLRAIKNNQRQFS